EDLIDEINRKHFVVANVGGKCLVGEWIPSPIDREGHVLSFQGPDAFKLRYGNQYVCGKQLGAYWLRHPRRRTYQGIELVPNGPELSPNGCLNLWRGFGVEDRQGEWPLLLQHICTVLANGNRDHAEYVLRWMAWCVQHPGEPAEAALVLKGKK